MDPRKTKLNSRLFICTMTSDEARVSIEEGGGGEYEPNLFFITINISTHLINNKISTIKKHKTTIS